MLISLYIRIEVIELFLGIGRGTSTLASLSLKEIMNNKSDILLFIIFRQNSKVNA